MKYVSKAVILKHMFQVVNGLVEMKGYRWDPKDLLIWCILLIECISFHRYWHGESLCIYEGSYCGNRYTEQLHGSFIKWNPSRIWNFQWSCSIRVILRTWGSIGHLIRNRTCLDLLHDYLDDHKWAKSNMGWLCMKSRKNQDGIYLWH